MVWPSPFGLAANPRLSFYIHDRGSIQLKLHSSSVDESKMQTLEPFEKSSLSRAVSRKLQPGLGLECDACSMPIKYSAKFPTNQIIANVYDGNVWQKVVHYHEECYQELDYPHGEPIPSQPYAGKSRYFPEPA